MNADAKASVSQDRTWGAFRREPRVTCKAIPRNESYAVLHEHIKAFGQSTEHLHRMDDKGKEVGLTEALSRVQHNASDVICDPVPSPTTAPAAAAAAAAPPAGHVTRRVRT